MSIASRKDRIYWHKKDGSKISIKDMSNEYLMKTIKNLEAQAQDSKGKVDEKKLDPMVHVLRMHAVQRNLITKI